MISNERSFKSISHFAMFKTGSFPDQIKDLQWETWSAENAVQMEGERSLHAMDEAIDNLVGEIMKDEVLHSKRKRRIRS